MQRYALIVAGGKGERLNPELPKQFMNLIEKPVLMYTIEAFSGNVDEVIVVIPHDFKDFWIHLCKTSGFKVSHKLVTGGLRRGNSVLNGLAYIPDDSLVAIHDGARPLVSHHLIEHCFDTALIHGNAIPALPPAESVMVMNKGVFRCADRAKVRMVQTPQVFVAKQIKDAYKKAGHLDYTDDASVFEAAGGKLLLVEGEKTNIKITTPVDFTLAGILLAGHVHRDTYPES